MFISENLFTILAFYWCQGDSAVNPSGVLFQGRLRALSLQAEITPQCLRYLHLQKLLRLSHWDWPCKRKHQVAKYSRLCATSSQIPKYCLLCGIPTECTSPPPPLDIVEDKKPNYYPQAGSELQKPCALGCCHPLS